jgi:methyl-accepting chemotaxis protein
VVADEIRTLATKSKKTVSESEGISNRASESIELINSRVESIKEDIDEAHISISIIHQSLNNTLSTR